MEHKEERRSLERRRSACVCMYACVFGSEGKHGGAIVTRRCGCCSCSWRLKVLVLTRLRLWLLLDASVGKSLLPQVDKMALA